MVVSLFDVLDSVQTADDDGEALYVNRTSRVSKHLDDTLEATGLCDGVFEPVMNSHRCKQLCIQISRRL